jgi:transposase-like protein
MAGKGAQSKLTRELIDQLCGYLLKGSPLTVACRALKINRSTVYAWLKQADERGGLYAELRDKIEAAEAQSNIDLIDVVRSCAIENRDWKAAQFLLMARLPEHFNYHRDRSVFHKHEVTGADGGPIQISAEAKIDAVIGALAPEELDALVRQALGGPTASPPAALIEGGSQAQATPIHQVPVPRVPSHPTLREVSRSLGGGGERDDQEADYLDAAEAWEVDNG